MLNRVFCLGVLLAHAGMAEAVDANIKELYSIYCASCHSAKGSEAPQAFNASIWKPRLDKGPDKVLANTIKGIGNMPPQGMCIECTQADLRELVRYMSGKTK